MRIIIDGDEYPIQPHHINTIHADSHFYGAFGSMEKEISARWIVRFCQRRGGGWASFTKEDIEAFYNEEGYQDFWFNGLDRELVPLIDGLYHVTHEFVVKCFRSSPNIKKKPKKT